MQEFSDNFKSIEVESDTGVTMRFCVLAALVIYVSCFVLIGSSIINENILK